MVDDTTDPPADVPAVRGDVRPRDPRRGRPGHARSGPTATTCGARASSARRARRSATCTTTPTACGRRWCATATTWREVTLGRGVRRGARSCCTGVLERARHRRRSPPTSATRRPTTSRSAATSALFIGLRAAARCIYSAGTVDQWPKNVVVHADVRQHVVDPGARHPAHRLLADHGRQPAGVAGQPARLRPTCSARSTRIRERGGKVVVVDPRRTGTADRADEWVPILPGTDAAFLLAVVPRALRRGPGRPRRTSADIVERRRRRARGSRADFTPEAVEAACRRPGRRRSGGSRTRSRPRRRRRVYGRIGLCNQEFGTLASWLVDVVNILTGNFDRPGGLDVRQPGRVVALASLPNPQWPTACTFGRWTQPRAGRARGARARCRSCLAEEIATPGEGQIRALVTIAGNPVISAPDAGRLDAALPELECMISVDNYLNETTRHAHVILPGLSRARAAALRRPDLGVGGAQRGNVLRRRSSRRRPTGPTSGRSCPARRPSRRACATPTSTSPRSTTATSRALCTAKRLDADRRSLAALRPDGGARAHARPADPHRARAATATARRPTASRSRSSEDAAARHRLRPDGAAPARAADARRRATIELAPAYITADLAALRHRARPRPTTGLRAGQPPAPALEQLVDAQREGAGEGQGPLHAARPPRRRGAHRPGRRRHGPRVSSEAGSRRGARRGERRDDAGRGVPPPRLGPRQGRAPACRSPASTPGVNNNLLAPGRLRRRARRQRRGERHPRRGRRRPDVTDVTALALVGPRILRVSRPRRSCGACTGGGPSTSAMTMCCTHRLSQNATSPTCPPPPARERRLRRRPRTGSRGAASTHADGSRRAPPCTAR